MKTFSNGQITLLDRQWGECMHSSVGPAEESKFVYIEQSGLQERLQFTPTEPLVLYDVGLGIGANAVAALEVFWARHYPRDLHLISFETNRNGLLLVLKQIENFPILRAHQKILNELATHGHLKTTQAQGNTLRWDLLEGDFRETLAHAPPPEIIFFDLYSPKKAPELWGLETFRKLFEKTAPLRLQKKSTRMITYSSSTAVRTAMLMAGFYVGYGHGLGPKSETTLGSTDLKDLEKPLDSRWLEHWKRSSQPYPVDIHAVHALQEKLDLSKHPQFDGRNP